MIFASLYKTLTRIGDHLQSLLLLYMRLTWGHQIFLAGLHKMQDMAGTEAFFASLNISHPGFHAYFVAILEFVCGLLFILGLGSRLAAIPIFFIMFAALGTAHATNLSSLRFISEPFILSAQAPYPCLITALLLFVFGPGKISFDNWIQKRLKERDR
jgi:putative oxidoreductase